MEGGDVCESYFFLVVHGDLDENHWVGRVAELHVVLHRLPFVLFLRLPAEQFDEDDDDTHVNPLNEEHQGHGQAHKHCNSQKRDDDG